MIYALPHNMRAVCVYVLLLMLCIGCGQRLSPHLSGGDIECKIPDREIGIAHPSPEALLANVCQALHNDNHAAFVALCAPGVRHAVKDLVTWSNRAKRKGHRLDESWDMLAHLKTRFCSKAHLEYDVVQADLVLVRNVKEGGDLALCRVDGVWYVCFDAREDDALYEIVIIIEAIKIQLGVRPPDQGMPEVRESVAEH